MNKFFILLVVLALGGGAYYYANFNSSAGRETGQTSGGSETTQTSAMRVEDNAVFVPEQRPGMSVRGTVVLAASGYLVIHEDNDGEPGAILGSSALLAAGENQNVEVKLSRASRDGEVLHAMLHNEKGGNTSFAAAEDTPVQSTFGGPISGFFNIANDAPLDTVISL